MPSDAQEKLSVIVFAGPNGSGKSTITQGMLRAGFTGEYINADDIARTLEPQIPDYLSRNIKAAEMAEQRRHQAIREHRPFSFETVMSTPEKVAIMTQAKSAGFEVGLVFVTTSDPEINVQRVANRVELGGHSVDPDKIRSRYHNAMALLPSAVEHADVAAIYDNSQRSERLVAIKRDNQLQLQPDAGKVTWTQGQLVLPYEARQASLRALGGAFEAWANENRIAPEKIAVRPADASHGKRYSGRVVAATELHVLQQIGANVLVIHDRKLLPAMQIEARRAPTIQYAYDKGNVASPGPERNRGQDKGR